MFEQKTGQHALLTPNSSVLHGHTSYHSACEGTLCLKGLLDHLDAQGNLGRYIIVSREGFGMTFSSRRRCILRRMNFSAALRDNALASYLLHVHAAHVFRDEIYLSVRCPCSKTHRKSLKLLKLGTVVILAARCGPPPNVDENQVSKLKCSSIIIASTLLYPRGAGPRRHPARVKRNGRYDGRRR